MSMLTEISDHLAALIDSGEAEVAALVARIRAHRDVHTKVETAIAAEFKVPTLADLRALIDKIPAA